MVTINRGCTGLELQDNDLELPILATGGGIAQWRRRQRPRSLSLTLSLSLSLSLSRLRSFTLTEWKIQEK